MPVWHVSVARIAVDRKSIKPVYRMLEHEVRDAARIAVKTLDGVGDKLHQWYERGDDAIHMRRQLSQPEIEMLHAVRPQCPVFTHGNARV